MSQGDRGLGGDADVVGDTTVGVVVLACAEEQAVVTSVLHPPSDQLVGDPGAPVELQPALDHQVRTRHANGERKYHRKHTHLQQNLRDGAVLEGVEQGPVPVVGPHREADLGEREQQQKRGGAADLPWPRRIPVRSGESQHAMQEIPAAGGGRWADLLFPIVHGVTGGVLLQCRQGGKEGQRGGRAFILQRVATSWPDTVAAAQPQSSMPLTEPAHARNPCR